MTPLSKEDVVRMADECMFDIEPANEYHADNEVIDSGNRWITDKMMAFATIARADLVAENERLKGEVANLNQRALDGDKSVIAANSLYKQLLYSQAENERLKADNIAFAETLKVKRQLPAQKEPQSCFAQPRDDSALAAAEADNERLRAWAKYQRRPLCMCFAGCDECDPANAPNIDDLLSKPRDDSALREMIAGVYAECAKFVEVEWDEPGCAFEIRQLAENRLRALADKVTEPSSPPPSPSGD